MLLVGLLVLVVVFLVVGLTLSSAAWLIATLVASAVALAVLAQMVVTSRRKRPSGASARPSSADEASAQVGARSTQRDLVSVGASAAQRSDGADSFSLVGGSLGTGTAQQTLVVDGRPHYHRVGCPTLAGLAAESVPLSQALEDGFTPCQTCRPDVAEVGGAQVAQPRPAGSRVIGGEVWVADGYPEYHVAQCEELAGLTAQPVPYEQAVDDGFQPCVVCNPDRIFGSDPRPVLGLLADRTVVEGAAVEGAVVDGAVVNSAVADGAVASAEVWVADGHPDYHVRGCARLDGLSAEPIPHVQAVEDGFAACSLCTPDAAGSAAEPVHAGTSSHHTGATAAARTTLISLAKPAQPQVATMDATANPDRSVWVVDGYPDFHRAQCRLLESQDSEPIPHDQAVEDGFTACAVCKPDAVDLGVSGSGPELPVEQLAPPEVWVVNGYPDYHRRDCRTLAGLDSEPVPLEQAVQDGFGACAVCTPDDVGGATSVAPPAAPATTAHPPKVTEPVEAAEPVAAETVLVAEPVVASPTVDAAVQSHTAQPTGNAEHTTTVQPTAALGATGAAAAAAAPAETDQRPTAHVVVTAVATPAAQPVTEVPPADAVSAAPESSADQVWVLDGRPRYHQQDCLIIKAQPAHPVSLAEAISEGLRPCSLCSR